MRGDGGLSERERRSEREREIMGQSHGGREREGQLKL